MTSRRDMRRQVAEVVLTLSAAGWIILLAGPIGSIDLALCGAAAAPWSRSSFEAIWELAPWTLLTLNWGLMLVTMMAPTLIVPVSYLYERNFRHQRARSIACFVIGYVMVWLLAGIILTLAHLLVHLWAPQSVWPLIMSVLLALVWQSSPAKQLCLNRSHNHYELSAFGLAADRDALGFGLYHGFWCVGSCWALMLIPMLTSQGHFIAMVAVTIVMIGERLEGPRRLKWRLRGLGKLTRIVLAQTSRLYFFLLSKITQKTLSRAPLPTTSLPT